MQLRLIGDIYIYIEYKKVLNELDLNLLFKWTVWILFHFTNGHYKKESLPNQFIISQVQKVRSPKVQK